ncbi:MAG: ferredoxin [bacterium]
MNLKVDAEKCIGCGTCVALAPDLFKMSGDKAEPINGKCEDEESANMSVDACPTQAIILS